MQHYSVKTALQLLERTPTTLSSFLDALPDDWVMRNEGPGTWSAFEVVGHLIFCEKNNFFGRIQIILSDADQKRLSPFDMSSQFEWTKGKDMSGLLAEFTALREQNLASLRANPLSEADLHKTGLHPKMGTVSLQNVLSTWVTHDLSHTAQILRVMAKQYKEDVGPFIEFLRILN